MVSNCICHVILSTMFYDILKGLLHPKMKIVSLITYPHVIPNHKSLVRLRKTILNILSQKSMKSIVKKYFCHQWFNLHFMKWQEYFLYAKKIKITTLFYNSSHLRHSSAILENIRWTQTAYAVLCQPHHTDTLFLLNNDLLNKVFLFSLRTKRILVTS